MKKKKSRLIVSLLTAFIMAFTVFPYMGAAGQVSAEEDPYVYDNSAKWNSFANNNVNLVKSIKYEPQSDGTFDATIDINTFACQQVIDGQDFIYFDGIGYSYKTGADSSTSYMYHDYYSSSTSYPYTVKDIVPGEQWTFWAWLSWDDMGQDPYLGCDFEKLTLTAPKFKPADCSHSWNSGTVTTAATCKVAGEKTYTCTVCSTTKTEPIDKTTNHSWNSGTVTTAATCKAAGVKTYKCTVCSTTKTEPIDKLTTHSYSNGACTVCGAADPTLKVAEFTINETITGISKTNNGQTVYTKTFAADNTVSLTVNAEHYSYSYQDYNFKLKLYGPNGTEIAPSSGNGYIGKTVWESSKFATSGNYTLKLVCGYTGLASGVGYKLTGSMKKDYVYKYKFDSLTATATESGMDNVPAVKIEYGDFDGPTGSVKELAIFREANGKIRKLDTSYYTGLVDNIKIDYGTEYTYYIVDLSYVTGTAKTTLSNVGTVDEPLTDAIKTALTDSHVTKSNTEKTKDIVLGSVSILKDSVKKGITSVELEWSNAYDGWTDSYIMESFNEKGQLMQTKEYTDGRFSGNVIYIPYEGVSKVKVTPCYTYKGVKMRNDAGADEISVESAKIIAPGVNVTKISNTKAAITTYKTTGPTGVVVQQKVGKKYKTVTTGTIKGNNNKGYKGTTKNTYTKSWTKNKAGKTSYRVCSYIIDQGNVYYSGWKTVKPKINKTTYTNYGISSIRMNGKDVYFRPLKIEYKGSKIKVTGKFYNTWKGTDWWAPNKDSGKFKITFKANHGNGKTVGYKTITSGKMKRWSTKTVTFYLSGAKKAQDLRTVAYSVKTYY